MAIQAARITGVKAGETILTEEQVLTGYETDVKYPALFNRNVVYSGTTANSPVYHGAGGPFYALMITIKTNGAKFYIQAPDDNYYSIFVIPANTFCWLPLMLKEFGILSAVTDKHAPYEVVLFYKV